MRTLAQGVICMTWLFLYTPIVILLIYAFNSNPYSAQFSHVTFTWFTQLLHDKALHRVTAHSFYLALTSATVATIIGSVTTLALHRFRFNSQHTLQQLILTLLLLPDLVLAISLLLLFSFMSFPLGFCSLLIAHVTSCLPITCTTLNSRITTICRDNIRAAFDLGASELQLLFTVLIPLLTPAIIASWLLCFALSFDDVVISFFVTGPEFQTLPLFIYSMIRGGVTPEINALSLVLIMVNIGLIGLAVLALRYRSTYGGKNAFF